MAQPDPETGSLPVELTHFVGRERELAALRTIAGTARLLTLTGAGGSGKSRLALELVPHLAASASDGVYWVELAPIMEPALITGAVLRSLGSPTEGGASSADAVIAAVRTRSIALVLDNCEHLVETCAVLADTLLRACPNLHIIATSREALGVAGERAWLVPPLALPAPHAPLTELAGSDAVRLFVDRARDVLPEFSLTAGNARAIADICTRVDGIPLAIELAAARVRHLSPEQIRDRLGDAFALLTSGSRTALPRHRTLRATLDWSHDLLADDARTVLRRLAVFRGGFTLDLVEDVAAGDGIAAHDVLDLMAALADRSLIMVREHDGTARYQLLETMRQYAHQKLEEAGELERVRARFADAVTAFIAEAEPSFTTTARRAAFARVEPELDNVREVLAWTYAHAPEQHVRLTGMLWWFWFSTRHWIEAHDWIRGALALPAAAQPTRERAALLFAAGALGALRAQSETARPLLEEAAAIAAALDDRRLEAYALNYIGMTWASTLSPNALEYTSRAAQWFRANGDDYGLRLALLLGGMARHGAGDRAAAIAMMEEAVAIARRFGQDRELAVALQTFATVLVASDDAGRARELVREAIEALRRDPSFLFIARGIEYYAYSDAERDPERAARTLGIAENIRRHIDAQRFAHDEVMIGGLIARLRERLGDATYDRCHAEGMQVQPADAIDDVLAPANVPDPAAASASEPATASARESATAIAIAISVEVPDLDIRALGSFEVAVQGRPIEAWPYAKPKELLAFLTVNPRGATRAEVGAALWPGSAPAQLRNSFHVTMHHLRRTIGHADWVVLERDRYRVAPDVTVRTDIDSFEQQVTAALALDGATASAALCAAMALYRDHFLAGEVAGGWRDDVQDRLRRTYCDAGLRLGALLEESGDFMAAAAAYEAVVSSEPLHETAHRGLLLSLTMAGRRAHALRHFERLTTLLQDLELEPEEETVELHERIRSAAMVPGS